MAVVVASSPKILELTVEEASGKNRSDSYVWDQETFEGFVKAEVRGGSKTVKATTDRATVKDGQITWQQVLHLEVQEGATELRLLLCREKTSNGKKGISVVTACGIFVKDILEAVPIDKYFEMFKPVSGLEGGYIRLRMKLVNPSEIASRDLTGIAPTRKKDGFLKKLVLIGGVAFAAYLATKRMKK